MGRYPLYFRPGMKREDITAKALAEAARAGDETALEVWRISGEQLGVGLAMLIDLLNPEVIVLGSIFARCQDLLWPHAQQVIHREALVPAVDCCRVLPAGLGEQLGDYAAAVAALFG
jgi:glucokinase